VNPAELHRLLRELHRELGQAGEIDAETRDLLKQLARDVEDRAGGAGATPPPQAPAVEEMAVRFESDHPALAAVLRQLVDALAKAGI